MEPVPVHPLTPATLAKGRLRQQGVTLVELMISVVIGLVIAGAASTVYIYSRQAFNSSTETSQVEENGKFALNLLTHYIKSAGFVMMEKTDPARPPLYPKMSGCDFGLANSAAPTNATLVADLGCLAATPAGARPSESITIFAETDAPALTGANFQGFNCVGTPATPDLNGRSLTKSHFFVGTTTVQTPKGPATVGQLACIADTTNAAGAPSFDRQPLIPGIEQITFDYLLPGANGDPTVAQVSTPIATLNTLNSKNLLRWSEVLAVDVCVLAKSSQPAANDTGTATYTDCNNATQTAVPGEVYRTFRTTVRLRN